MVVGGVGPWVTSQGDGWSLAIDAVSAAVERATPESVAVPLGMDVLLSAPGAEPGASVIAVIGDWAETAGRLGMRTAQLHSALARVDEPSFRPEPFGELYQRALYQSVRNRFNEAQVAALQRAGESDQAKVDAARTRELFGPAAERLRPLLDHPFECLRIRGHGDLRLEHFLYADGEMVIVDFEGDPTRPMSERRIKRSPYADLAALIASSAQAAAAGLDLARQRSTVRHDGPWLQSWLISWLVGTSAAVLNGYLSHLAASDLAMVPRDPGDSSTLLRALLIDAFCERISEPGRHEPAHPELLVQVLAALVD